MTDQDWLFSFFFITNKILKGAELYFVCFQEAIAPDKAHQIIIADCKIDNVRHRKVAYILGASSVEKFDNANLEKLCRIAVDQFLSKLPLDNFLAQVLPLKLPGSNWSGQIIPVDSTVRDKMDDGVEPHRGRSTTGVRGANLPSTPRHSSSLG